MFYAGINLSYLDLHTWFSFHHFSFILHLWYKILDYFASTFQINISCKCRILIWRILWQYFIMSFLIFCLACICLNKLAICFSFDLLKIICLLFGYVPNFLWLLVFSNLLQCAQIFLPFFFFSPGVLDWASRQFRTFIIIHSCVASNPFSFSDYIYVKTF